MILPEEFHTLDQEQKIALLINMIKDSYQHSPALKKIYAYITSELQKDMNVLDKIYTGLSVIYKENKEHDVQKNIDDVKKIQEQGWRDFDEAYLDDLLSKA